MIGQKVMVSNAVVLSLPKLNIRQITRKYVLMIDSCLNGGWCSSGIRNQSVHPSWFPVDEEGLKVLIYLSMSIPSS